jgi:alanine racemase
MNFTEARLTVDLDALAANHALLRQMARGAEVAPVVKADGYGLGAAPVARRLIAEGAASFFVARVSEGEALRRVIGAAAAIYVLDGCPLGGADRLHAAGLVPVINHLAQAREWLAFGAEAKTVPVALQIDLGMNRLGFTADEAEALSNVGGALSELSVALVLGHLSCGHAPDHPLNALQRQKFAEVRRLFPNARASLANSSGVFLGEDFLFDLVRPGIALVGGGPFGRPDPRIAPVATLEAPILQVRAVEAGESIGYGAAFTAAASMRVAIVAAGYADGVLRAGSPGGFGWIGGQFTPLLGRVSMDLIAIDVTRCDEAQPGAMVQLLGPDVLVDDAAANAGTISYELLTRLSVRAERRYLGAAGGRSPD